MVVKAHGVECSGCGRSPSSIGQTECEWCGNVILVSTFTSVDSMPMPMVNQFAAANRNALQKDPDNPRLNSSLGMCYLKLKLYDKALAAFEKAIEDNFDNPETFFYAAVCVLGGKKAFLVQRPQINKIEEYINAALMIEPRGIFHYFLAYIKYDYFERKYLNTSPNYREAMATANQMGLSPFDIEQLYGVLGVSRPDEL